MKGSDRNKPCQCGSGKKQKRCHPDMRQRTESVVFDFGKPVALSEVHASSDGSIQLFSNGERVRPEAAWIQTEYARPKRPKVMNRIPIPVQELNSNAMYQLHRCMTLIAIDTNTKTIGGDSVSVSSAVWAIVEPNSVQFGSMGAVELRNARGNPERVAWRLMVQVGAGYQLPVGIIVDSELGLLEAINRGEEPVEGAVFLPNGWHLIYASADTGREMVPNLLLRQCDRHSAEILKTIAKDPSSTAGLNASTDASFTHSRRWPAPAA
jgi:hypothetical protein